MLKEKPSILVKNEGLVTPSIDLKIEKIKERSGIKVYSVKEHTFLIGLKEILPEDVLWRKEHPRVPSLICFQNDKPCGCSWGCVVKLASRCFWLFQKLKKLEQLLILFNREEKALERNIPNSSKTLGRDLKFDDFSSVVPRVQIMHIQSNFDQLANPYRIFRANYNGLQLVLAAATEEFIGVPIDFW